MTAKNTQFYTFPDTFQKNILKKLTEKIKNGESVHLVGPPGIGNSLLVDALVQVQSIREKYFGNENYKFVVFDSYDLIERRPDALLRQLAMSIDVAIDTELDRTELLNEVKSRINDICQKNKLVIILDHVEELNSPQQQPFFKSLYKLYRPLERDLSFITVTSQKLHSPGDVENFGQFSRVMLQNIIRNQPFSKEDSIWFIKENAKRFGVKLNDDTISTIYQITGGYPRTIKRVVESISKGRNLSEIVSRPEVDQVLSMHLEQMLDYQEYSQRIPLISRMNEHRSDEGETIENIRFNSSLTKQESKLLKIFTANKSEIVSREDGIRAVWGNNAVEISDHAYDQIVHRLRKKLENSEPKVELSTVRGRGHRLIIE